MRTRGVTLFAFLCLGITLVIGPNSVNADDADDGKTVNPNWVTKRNLDPILKAPGDIVNSFPAPGTSPKSLAWDGEYLWVNDFTLNKIFQINTKNSTIINSINAPLISPTGLTHDGNYLWLSDTTNKNIYKINSFNG